MDSNRNGDDLMNNKLFDNTHIIKNPIGERIRKLRLEKGLTQNQLAKEVKKINPCLKTRQQSIDSIENGYSKKPTILYEIAKALDNSVEFLTTGNGEKFKDEKSNENDKIKELMEENETLKNENKILKILLKKAL